MNIETHSKLGRKLVLDELFDLTLYRKMRESVSSSLRPMLDELIATEEGHYAFWKNFFQSDIDQLDIFRRIKMAIILFGIRVFGDAGAHLALEAIEVHGIRKYLDIWKRYQDTPVGSALRGILEDEFRHEDAIVSETIKKRIHPERVRDLFLGFNDGMIEILGAVVGFLAAFDSVDTVLAASVTVAVAGAISMAAGAFASTNSEYEIAEMEHGKEMFLGNATSDMERINPLVSASIVGVAYIFGSLVPILPIVFGVTTLWGPIVSASVITVVVSGCIAFLSGMRASRRIGMNLAIVAIAVSVTYSIGVLARNLWGIQV